MNLPNGTLLHGGTYKIIRQIGSGGFGVTYEAEHVMLQKRVAIKEFFVKDFCNRDETTSHVSVGTQSKAALVDKLKKKFFDEAVAINRLDHPNIVKVSDVFVGNGTFYYVMDYIDGLSLNEILKKKGKLSEQKAVKYILQVADALKYIHSQNRLHLDIKPGNIMIDNKDNAILIDFGASKQYDEEGGENTSTLPGKTLGYAPIEQMGNCVQTFTPATDIYALGATLYKLITGITPPEATLLASGEGLQPIGDEISEEVKTAIRKSMELNKRKRPQSIDAFVRILKPSHQRKGKKNEETIIDNIEELGKDSEETILDTNIPQSTETQSIEPQENNDESMEDIEKENDDRRKSFIIPGIIAVVVLIIVLISMCKGNTSNTSIPIADNDTIIEQTDSIISGQDLYVTTSKGISFYYTGQIVDSIPNGIGTGRYDNGEYNGQYVNGLREGDNGRFETYDGKNIFEGSFKNDEYEKGTLTLNTGEYFIGDFKDGQPYNGSWQNADGTFNSEVVNGK